MGDSEREREEERELASVLWLSAAGEKKSGDRSGGKAEREEGYRRAQREESSAGGVERPPTVLPCPQYQATGKFFPFFVHTFTYGMLLDSYTVRVMLPMIALYLASHFHVDIVSAGYALHYAAVMMLILLA